MKRQPDAHLNSAELLALLHPCEPRSGPEEAGVLEARKHVVSCNHCQSLLDLHAGRELRLAQLRVRLSPRRAYGCPPESEWLNLAAGLIRGRKAEDLLDHAAVCDHCGLLLRQSLAEMAEDVTAEEEQFLSGLESVRPARQEDMASLLSSEMRRPTGDWGLLRQILQWLRRPVFTTVPVPAWGYAAFAALVATLVLITGLNNRPPGGAPTSGAGVGTVGQHLDRGVLSERVEDLLARAYTAHRTLELRVPQAAYGPLRLMRGSTAMSHLDRPPELLRSEAKIGRELAEKPNDPRWLQARGRAELLDRNFDSAIADLQRCLTLQPDLPHLMTDQASAYYERAEGKDPQRDYATDQAFAYFERAETKDTQRDYATALDLLDRSLQVTPDDQVALFNRAIVCQRMHLYPQAVIDWRHYLRVDPDSKWAAEARQRLAAVEHAITFGSYTGPVIKR